MLSKRMDGDARVYIPQTCRLSMPPSLVARLAPIVYCTPRRESETNGGAEPEVQRLEEPSAEDGTRARKRRRRKVLNTRGAQATARHSKCVHQRARSANATSPRARRRRARRALGRHAGPRHRSPQMGCIDGVVQGEGPVASRSRVVRRVRSKEITKKANSKA